jgi:hypothetical protein
VAEQVGDDVEGDACSRRSDRVVEGDDGADRNTKPLMAIGDHRHMMKHRAQRSAVSDLLGGTIFQVRSP